MLIKDLSPFPTNQRFLYLVLKPRVIVWQTGKAEKLFLRNRWDQPCMGGNNKWVTKILSLFEKTEEPLEQQQKEQEITRTQITTPTHKKVLANFKEFHLGQNRCKEATRRRVVHLPTGLSSSF